MPTRDQPPPPRDPGEIVFEKLVLYQKELYGAAAAYENVVIGAGYVGFFAIWNGTAPHLPHQQALLSGALIGISLTLYVVWNSLQLAWRTWTARRYAVVFASGLTGQPFLEAYQAVDVRNAQEASRIVAVWPVVFLLSLATGLGAAGLVIGQAIAEVFANQAIKREQLERKGEGPSPRTMSPSPPVKVIKRP